MPPRRAPLVSVVIPAYEAGSHVADAVASVLLQDHEDLECIVVDDGSTDETAQVLAGFRDPRLRCHRQENSGVSHARNTGVRLARGELVAFLDADDVWLPTKLSRQVQALRDDPGLGAVLCDYVVVTADLRPRRVVSSRDPERRILAWSVLEGEGPSLPSTVLVRRGVLDVVGGFDPRFPPSEDLHFGARLLAATRVGTVTAPLSLYRRHPGQHHLDLSGLEAHMLGIFADLLRTPEQEPSRRRATANLHTRLLFTHLRRRDARAASRALVHAWRAQPRQLVALPLRVAWRRLRERSGALLAGTPPLPQDLLQRLQGLRDVAPAREEA